MEVLNRELEALYQAYAAGRPSPLAELPVQYPDYAVLAARRLEGPALDAQLAYWKRQLADLPVTELPADRPRPAIGTFRGARQTVSLPAELVERLRTLGMAEAATPFMVLLAGFQALLTRYTGQVDPVVGMPVANRARPETEGLIGFFVNTLVLRADLGGRPSFREAVRRAREVVLAAHAHQELPFEKLVASLAPERRLDRNPLFQITFHLLNLPSRDTTGDTHPFEVHKGTANVDLAIDIELRPDSATVYAEYATDLFDHARMARLLEHYVALLAAAAAAPDLPLGALPIITPAERRRLLAWGTGRAVEVPAGVTVPELVAQRAAADPTALALVAPNDGDSSGASGECVEMSYGELVRRAARLTTALARDTAAAASPPPVAVLLERSPALPVALLGVMASGSPYLPLDPAQPPARLARAIADASAEVVITSRRLTRLLPPALADRAVLIDWLGDIELPNAVPETADAAGPPRPVRSD